MTSTDEGVWEYNAPQFIDFSEPVADDATADKYFDFDHENGVPVRFSVPAGSEVGNMNNLDISSMTNNTAKDTAKRQTLRRESYNIVKDERSGQSSCEDNVTDSETHTEKKADDEDEQVSEEKETTQGQKSGQTSCKEIVTDSETHKAKKEDEEDKPVNEEKEITQEKNTEERVPKNIATSLEAWRSKTKNSNTTVDTGKKKVLRRKARQQHIDNSEKKVAVTTQIVQGIRNTRRSPVVKSNANKPTHPRATRSLDGPLSKKPKTGNENKSLASEQKKPKLTMPSTPTTLKRNFSKPGAQSVKSSEELELEKIAEFRHNLAEKRKLAEESLKKSQSNAGHHPVRPVSHVTRPAGFHFATDDRIKSHAMETRNDVKAKNFVETLRHHPPSPVSHDPKKGPTVAKPFNFTDSRKKRKHDETQEEPAYKSMAVLINEFQSRTPDRFRLKPRSRGNTPQKSGKATQKLTIAKTPSFETRNRKRAVTAISAAEREEMEVQEMKNYKFKANPINPKVFSDKATGLKKVAKKPCTEAVGFDLETDHRTQIREASKQKKEEKYEFHAKPVPTQILEKPLGLGEKKLLPITQPKSPAFALKNRVRLQKEEDSILEEEVKPKFARPAPQPGIPFAPKLSHKTTEIQPFSFEERDKDRLAKKEEKIKQVFDEEEKARQFKAQSLPSPSIQGLPEKKPKQPTKPDRNLLVEEKGAKAADEWRKKIEDELKNQRAKASAFKAQPTTVLYSEPFVPEKTHKPLTEIEDFQLNTDKRSQQREQFEQYKKHKEQELEAEKVRRQKEETEMEADAIAKLRAEMVHKSNPIKHFKPVEVMPSTKPLTDAASPQFRTSQRLRNKRL
ncbi:LOW QUALITY PROTEIN: targeting protein for Xklp2 homolog [Ptychodera flava]|uniref:LOW QUALITY PROTEIN: targeting protein for Xklp2 homolog n=1 Tax=Ptychodera flava TaxID=63121 RepID=UPI00396A115E